MEVGDREEVLSKFYQVIGVLSSQEIEEIKSSPAWPARLAIAHTLPREPRADESYIFDAQRFKDFQIPTLLLEGGDGRDFEKKGNKMIAAALPQCSIVLMPGQQHIAKYTAPDIFSREVIAFLSEGLIFNYRATERKA